MEWEYSHKQISHELFTCPPNFEFIILSTWELHKSETTVQSIVQSRVQVLHLPVSGAIFGFGRSFYGNP